MWGGVVRDWVVVVKETDLGFEGDIVGLGGAYGRTMGELMDRLLWMMVESEENGRPLWPLWLRGWALRSSWNGWRTSSLSRSKLVVAQGLYKGLYMSHKS
jgi:hypothetical protein